VLFQHSINHRKGYLRVWRRRLAKVTVPETQRLYFYSLIVGVLSGLVAILFEMGLHYAQGLTFTKLLNFNLQHPHGENSAKFFHFEAVGEPILWAILFLPAIGGLISGLIIHYYAPDAKGTGTDAMIDAFHNKVGRIPAFTPFLKGVTTIVTLATGGSIGKEGPVAQIGAGLGSFLASKLGIGVRARRTLLLAGTAGGLGAIFQAPLGGALTAVEVLYHEDIEGDALIPCVISSITAYAIFGTVFGFSHIFYLPGTESMGFYTGELFIFILMAVVCSGVGFLYVKCFYGMRDRLFEPLNMRPWLKPALGGLGLGLIGVFCLEILGSGFGYLQQLIKLDADALSWSLVGGFALIGALKIVATSLTLGSGGSGGVFAPSLFIGSMIGAIVGGVAYLAFPSMVQSPFGAFVVVGMCSFFAGVAHAPIAAVIMISEMTGGYSLLAPLMLVSVLAIMMSQRWSIYEKQVQNKFFSKAHVGDMTIDVLQGLKISVLEPYRQVGVISSHTLFTSGERFGQKIHASDLVLVDHDDIYCGMVSLRDVQFDMSNPLICNLITLEDIMTTNVTPVTPDLNLHEALVIISSSEFDKVPVLRSLTEDEPHLLGYLSYNDILEKYHEIVNPHRIH
jgi:chloride channel protein, CIC family